MYGKGGGWVGGVIRYMVKRERKGEFQVKILKIDAG
jgi:hypothetical protein